MSEIKKITIWHNPTKILDRWDGEVAYENGDRERKIDIDASVIDEIKKIMEGVS